ncbi:glycosyltransferase [Salinarimonas ramus]|uniref:glycosyltransferase n=1 Tax=Salinarimonas ramus TaxID=690164 RepID=UPI001FCEF200|nr:glycosyltransferase [Salinarimonas ramus]
MPTDIAFLLDHGVRRPILETAAAAARESGVDASDVLLARGLVSQDRFYRALAAAVEAPFLADVTLGPQTLFPDAIVARRAVLAHGGTSTPMLVTTPDGRETTALLERGKAPAGYAITTPPILRRAVFGLHAAEIARRAAHTLPDKAPHFSYRDGPHAWQIYGPFVFATALLLGTALVSGTLAVAGMVACLIFVVMAALRGATCLEDVPTSPLRWTPRMPDVALPVYTILVPLLNEAEVVAPLVEALAALDYPLEKLDIKLLVEAHDVSTAAAIEALALPAAFETIVVPRGEPLTKPRALNAALPLARGAFTVVYDAEDRPDPDQLRLAVAAFDREGPDLACLQARLVIHNSQDALIAALFAIEYAALFDVVNPGLLRLGLPIPLGGTSNHFRTSALAAIGGWDAWNVTEDADIGLRLGALGLRIGDLPSATREEAPTRLPVWLRQRARWMKGFLQTLLVHTRAPRRTLAVLGPARTIAVWLLVGGTVLSALLFPLSLAIGLGMVLAAAAALVGAAPEAALLDDLVTHASIATLAPPLPFPVAVLAATTFAVGMAATLVVAEIALRRRKRRDLRPMLALLPVYLVLVSLGAWRGVWDLALRPYHWHKTTHGLAPPERLLPRLRRHAGALRARLGGGRVRGRAPAE